MPAVDVAFKGILYEFYSEDLSEKVKTSLSVRRASGKYLAPFAPYGYRKSQNDKNKLEVDEEAAHIVKRIYNEYICGSSMYQIAQKLNEEHVITLAEYISRKGIMIHLIMSGRPEHGQVQLLVEYFEMRCILKIMFMGDSKVHR